MKAYDSFRREVLYIFTEFGILIKQVAIEKYEEYTMQNCNFVCFLYGSQSWSLTFREENRLMVFKNRVLKKICGPKEDKITGDWRRLHN